jgi:DNA-binding transcriptional LysR family regulator
MRTIDLESLEIFRAVVEEGGVIRAANKLNRVQSNITTRVRQLEERLGVSLFQRQGRALALTSEGNTLLGYADRLLRLAAEAENELRQGKPAGTFRLGSLESTAGSRLPPLLASYHQRHPRVQVELSTGTTGRLVSRVERFELDAAFVSEPFTAPALNSLPVFQEELVLITGLSYPAIHAPAELGRATLIAFAHGCSYRKRLEDWLGEHNFMPARVLEFASYQAMIACVAAGAGFAIAPKSVLASQRAGEDIRQHALPEHIGRNRTHLIWQGEPSTALQGLIEMIGESPR